MPDPIFTSPVLQTGSDGTLLTGIVPQSVADSQIDVGNGISSGDAFLTLLNRMRTDGTSRTADALYGKISSGVEKISPNGKETAKGEKVRVVKLHLKRTRSSETMARADAAKAADRQKIPSADRSSPALAAQTAETPAPAPQSRNGETDAAETKTAGADFTADAPEIPAEDKLTAADILLMSALPQIAPVQTAPEQTVDVKAAAAETVSDSAEEEDSVLSPREKTAAPEHLAGGKRDDIVPQESAPDPEIETDARPERKEPLFTPLAHTEKTAARADAAPVETDDGKTAVPLYHKKAVAAETRVADVRRPAAVRRNEDVADAEAPAVETRNGPERAETKTYTSGRAERQAALLSEMLPAETSVAVHVETETVPTLRPETEKKRAPRQTLEIEHETAKQEQNAEPVEAAGPAVEQRDDSPETVEKDAKADAPRFAEKPVEDAPAPTERQTFVPEAPVAAEAETQTAAETVQPLRVDGVSAVNAPATTAKNKPAPAAAPVPKTPTPENELVDQIKVKISKAVKEGIDKIEIVLKPKELGTIRVKLIVGEDGKTTVSLTAANRETLELLQKEAAFLKQALTDAGMNMSDGAFAFFNRGEQSETHQNENSARFLHNDLTEETDDVSTEETSPAVSGNHALNIKV